MTNKYNLYDDYIKRLINVNDETKTEQEHKLLLREFTGWKQGVFEATGERFNGDYYYIDLFDSGIMAERPICCGVFLDWRHNPSVKENLK